ncbi:HAD hydrolase-like protein, partial [Georgenia sp. 10Sc9-8]|nr:HAD hydrolase-like protein [Georgenia halotolerans]
GVRALRAAGVRLVTLSNGGAEVAHGLLERAGVREEFEALLSVQDAPRWKPAPEAYAHALQHAQVTPADAMLVAVHPWDVDGASRAGLRTAWVNRSGGPYPDFFRPPEATVGSLTELADRWARD